MTKLAGATPLPIIPSREREFPDKGSALDYFLSRWDAYTLNDLGPALTCAEAEALCDLYAAHGLHDKADALRAGHAAGDDEGDANHNEGW